MSDHPSESVPSIDWDDLERRLTGIGPTDAAVLDRRAALLEQLANDPAAMNEWLVMHPQRFATTMGWCGAGYEIVRQLSRSLSERTEAPDV